MHASLETVKANQSGQIGGLAGAAIGTAGNTARKKPDFDPGFVVSTRTFAVDKKGNAWWIDPDARSVWAVD